MRLLLVCMGLWTYPLCALGSKVAVLPVDYQLVWKGAESPEKGALIEKQVVLGAADAGLDPIRGDPVAQAVKAVSPEPSGTCEDPECVAAVARELQVQQAIGVSVREAGAQHEIRIVLARGDGVAGELFGNFSVVEKGLRSMVGQALASAARNAASAEPSTRQTAKGDTAPAKGDEAVPGEAAGAEAMESAPIAPRTDGIAPTAFYVSAGMTGALTIATIITEAMTLKAYDECDQGCNDSYWEKGKNLQVLDRVLLGCTAAAAVTTGVLFLLTDFDGADERTGGPATASTSLVPVLTENGGMVTLWGRF